MQISGKLAKSAMVSNDGGGTPESVDIRALALVQTLRPVKAWLSERDYWHLQQVRRHCASSDGGVLPLLSHYIRAKLQDAQLLEHSQDSEGIAGVDSRVTYSVNGTTPRSGTIFYQGFAEGQGGIPLRSLLGVTLVGMKAGQTTALLRADGTTEKLELVDVPWRGGPSRP